jgi:hypothetical protein
VHKLTALDDQPWHQAAAPFGEAATSDPHFNDGYYFSAYDPEGSAYVFMGLRVHANNNVLDGYAGAVYGTRQASIRLSRELRPEFATRVGPLSVEFAEPMSRIHLALAENASGVAFDLEWTATARAFLETRHLTRRYGRVTNDLLRYTQTGRTSGEVRLPDGRRLRARAWYGCRDHSWGIRQAMGPDDRPRGTRAEPGDPRALRLWVPFEVGDHAGFFHLHEDRSGRRLDFEGFLQPLSGGEPVPLAAGEHRIEYGPDGRLSRSWFRLLDGSGRAREYTATPLLPPAHPMGFGYSRGWSDGGSPGVWRGAYREEVADWEVAASSPPEALPLGGTEFVCRLEHEGQQGMAHVEHMLYHRP